MLTAIFIVLLLCLTQLFRIRQYVYVAAKNQGVINKDNERRHNALVKELKRDR